MMRLTARLRTTCGKCGEWINVGEEILWSPGVEAEHLDCGDAGDRGDLYGDDDLHSLRDWGDL